MLGLLGVRTQVLPTPETFGSYMVPVMEDFAQI